MIATPLLSKQKCATCIGKGCAYCRGNEFFQKHSECVSEDLNSGFFGGYDDFSFGSAPYDNNLDCSFDNQNGNKPLLSMEWKKEDAHLGNGGSNIVKKVWLDCDPMNGNPHGLTHGKAADQDDGFALCALVHSKRIKLIGLSAVWGNGSIDETYDKLVELVGFYDPNAAKTPPIYRGCSRPIKINAGEKGAYSKTKPGIEESDAVLALTEYLQSLPDGETLTICAIGPLTNIGTVLLRNPDLAAKIEEVVVCAGRNGTDDHFVVGTDQKVPFVDMNFDFDNTAFEIMLQLEVPLVLAGWQISKAFCLETDDLTYLQENGCDDLVRYLGNPENCTKWMDTWCSMGNRIDKPTQPIKGFHPFDLLTASYLFYREGLKVEQRKAKIVLHSDDTLPDQDCVFKYYLTARENSASGVPVKFVTDAVNRMEYKNYIMQLLLKDEEE